MEANVRNPRELFDGKVLYEVPPFQRPYVWERDDQWQPLWDDIERLAHARLNGDGVGTHFLGAVVLKQLPSAAGDPSRHSVIDGQQRLTTLQLVLDAAQLVVAEEGHEDDAEALGELVWNGSSRFRGTPMRFKLWSSRTDRSAFEHAMDDGLRVAAEHQGSKIAAAHGFFVECVRQWVRAAGDERGRAERLAALAAILQDQLSLVTINLSGSDDDQHIFETLNDRGTPLLGADLVKNYLFQRGLEVGADVDAWGEQYWSDFDDEWWRTEVSQGRSMRARIDLFLQYWLTMRIQDEVLTDQLLTTFRQYTQPLLGDPSTADALMAELRRDADTFHDFADEERTAPVGQFYSRVVEAMELGATLPLLLWLTSENHLVPQGQLQKALAAVESWVVRRTLLRRTMKNVNRTVVLLLKELDRVGAGEAGDATVAFLLAQDADANVWPTDEELRRELPETRVYGPIKQQRLRTVLAGIEQRKRSDRHEAVQLPERLEIEHVMPREWRAHWDRRVARDPELAGQRDHLINTLGNITLVTAKLNGTLSHRPWTDRQAKTVAPSGRLAGQGKRTLLSRYSLLVLNKEIVDYHPAAWTDEDIRLRGRELTEAVVEIWKRG